MARKKTESPPTEGRPPWTEPPPDATGPPGLPPSKLMEAGGNPATPAPEPGRYAALVRRLENDFKYHAPKEGQPAKYEQIRAAGGAFAKLLVELCPDGRELAIAVGKIEEAVFWGNAAIARS